MTSVNVPSRLLWYSRAVAVQVVEEQVGIAVVVVVDPGGALAAPGRRPATPALAATSSKVPSPLVVIQPVGLLLAADEQVEQAVVVVVGPGGGVGVDRVEQARPPR